jgi:hypothetical protein
MEWLVTTKARKGLSELESKLAQWGCELTGTPPIPLGDDEQVIEVSGPRDLPEKARQDPDIIKVSPNSPITLY